MYSHDIHAYDYEGYIRSIHECDFETVLNMLFF